MHLSFSLLSALPASLFLITVPGHLWELRASSVKALSGRKCLAKSAVAILLLLTQAADWVVLSKLLLPSHTNNFALLSRAVSFTASVALCPILLLEHARSIRPSDLTVLYLLASSAFDIISLGTANSEKPLPSPFLTSTQLCLKLLLLGLESQSKFPSSRRPYQLPAEQTAGVLNRTFFWWINTLLFYGSRCLLTQDGLPSIDQALSSGSLRRRMQQAWQQRTRSENITTLPTALFKSLMPSVLSPIIPRLFLLIFRYSQPTIIRRAIHFLNEPRSSFGSAEKGCMLIITTAVVYVGMAVCTVIYQHRVNRLKAMIRGSIVGLIHSKSIQMQSDVYDNGRAVTLISTDTDSVVNTAEWLHEAWAQAIGLVLGVSFLAQQIGWIWPVPLALIFFCSRLGRYVRKDLQSKQREWNGATQNRLAMTSSMLHSIKSLKALGFSTQIQSLIHELRLQELLKAEKVRWVMVHYTVFASAFGILSPVITLGLFAIRARLNGSSLDTESAFTTTAIIGMVTQPANVLLSILPQAVSSLTSFERIQKYMTDTPRHDRRLLQRSGIPSTTNPVPAIRIQDVTIMDPSGRQSILQSIDLSISPGSTVVCSGSVGSGKTVLAKAILGEIHPTKGAIFVSSKRIGFCAQSAWLPSSTIKDAICGYSKDVITSEWYQEVIRACCLDVDLASLPDGDRTMIGSRGFNLSGGQRQRVALARAVYTRCEIVILDDSFSALDGRTESSVVNNLLGSNGIFKRLGTTVLFLTSTTQHFNLADWVVILENSKIQQQGTWTSLKVKPSQLSKVTFDDVSDRKVEHASESPGQKQQVTDTINDISRRTGDISLYSYYIESMGYKAFLLMAASTATYAFFLTLPQHWLKLWTEKGADATLLYLGGYLTLCILAWLSASATMWITSIYVAPRSGLTLHQRLLSTIIGAPISYFSTTDTGAILNRFSQDIQLIDNQLPTAISGVGNQVFKTIMQALLLLSAQRLVLLILPICVGVVYAVQKVYLRTSRQLRLLDLESRSAVCSSFLETIEGITTIRAFGWEEEVVDNNVECLDVSQRPFYLLLCLQRWLNMVLDLMVAGLATGIVAFSIISKGSTSGGQIGVALNIILVANTTLLRLVESWTNMEISLGAISRLKSIETHIPSDDKPWEDYEPPTNWPSSGAIEIDHLTVAYDTGPAILRNINLKVSPGQKLIVCGRTGSGKSTLVSSLLRLLDTQSGTIRIDDVDLSHVRKSIIRQRCITVPQDSWILNDASLRFNIDPSQLLPDDAIITALQKTQLWSHFTGAANVLISIPSITDTTTTHEILDCTMHSLPQMSAGQLQLFSLARAICQAALLSSKAESRSMRPILLLDEATSSLDLDTESIIHDIIQSEFTERGHTVIAITHRLSGVIKHIRPGIDKVTWLRNGKLDQVEGIDEDFGFSVLPDSREL